MTFHVELTSVSIAGTTVNLQYDTVPIADSTKEWKWNEVAKREDLEMYEYLSFSEWNDFFPHFF